MTNLVQATIRYGSIQYASEVLETPATSKTNGNVTINNTGSPGSPAHYTASFLLGADFEDEGLKVSNLFHWNINVVNAAKDAPYSEIEAAAARRIAPMLRQLADAVEQDVGPREDLAQQA